MSVDVGFQWAMLNDHDRNAAYKAAIERGSAARIVYDLGAGIGTMSYYALIAGARRVYGFEVNRDTYPHLRRLARRFPNFFPVRADVLRGRLPPDRPDVIVCEMWSAWLIEWPMVKALGRILRRSPRAQVIPACGHHVVQLVQARHRAGLPVQFAPGVTATRFDEPWATAEMSLPALACTTDFRREVRPVDVTVSLIPLATGVVNAVRLYSYEEVSAGHILPRIDTRCDEIILWLAPARVRRGRRVQLKLRHRWNAVPLVRLE
jgi:predicted RNA methylase